MEAIEAKLKRTTIRLSEMQDIAGCRMIFKQLAHVRDAENRIGTLFQDRSRIKDYINAPKPDGYRGVHYICDFDNKYVSTGGTIVEIQMRTRLQHMWATALETVDTFTGQNLKLGNGHPEWARFFMLISGAFALMEGCTSVPKTPQTLSGIREELKQFNAQFELLTNYAGVQIFHAQFPVSPYYIIYSDLSKSFVRITPVQVPELQSADQKLADMERTIRETDSSANVVMVSVDAIASLREAYPNYFADMTSFLDETKLILGV